jgi:hypothetical protein
VAVALALVVAVPVVPAAVRAAVDAPELLTPAEGSHVDGTPVFGWMPVAGAASYLVQIAGPAGFASPLVARSTVNRWLTTTEALPAGPVAWRVAVLDGTGSQGPWAEGGFTIDGSLAAPVLAPAVVVAPWPGTAREIAWQPVDGAAGYDVRLGTGTVEQLEQVYAFPWSGTRYVVRPSMSVPGVLAPTMYWQVRARGAGGLATGPWSAVGELRSSWTAAPGQVTADGAQLVDELVLDWDRLPGASQYVIEIEPLDGQGATEILGATPSRLVVAWNQWPDRFGAFRWRVRGVSRMTTSGDPFDSAWSGWRTVTVVRRDAPALLAPAAGATVDGQPRFSWTPVPRMTGYELQIATDAGFGSGVRSFNVSDTVIEAGTRIGDGPAAAIGIADGGTYWWRVRAMGGSTPWSTPRSFTVDAPAIELLGPADGATVDVPTLTWDGSRGLAYRVEIRDGVGAVVASGLTSTGRWTPPRRLAPADGPFTWQVRAIALEDHDRVIASSGERSFDVVPLQGTASEAVVADPPAGEPWFTVAWPPVSGADHYAIFRSWHPDDEPRDPLADGLGYPAFTHPGPWINPVGSSPETGMPWRVIAYAADGSEISRGPARVIDIPRPAVPVVTGPDACATADCGTPTSPTFSWAPSPNAVLYTVHVDLGPSIIPAGGTTTGTSLRLTSIGINTRRRLPWTVAACSAVVCSDRTPVREFWWSRVVPAHDGPAEGAVMEDEATVGFSGGTPPAAGPGEEPAWTYQDPAYVRSGGTGTYVADDTPAQISWGFDAYYDGTWRTFTLQASPPDLITPAADAVTDATPLLRWTPLAGNLAYVVEVHRGGTEPLGMDTVVTRDLAYDASHVPSTPLAAGEYRWRVQRGTPNVFGYGTVGSPWSATGTFSVLGGAPATLVAPVDGATATPSDLLLAWEPVAGAAAYQVELSRDASFAVLGYAAITATAAWAPGALLSGGTWHWRVVALGPGETAISTSTGRALVVDAPVQKPLRNAVVIDDGWALTVSHEVRVTFPIAVASGARRVRVSNDGITWRTFSSWFTPLYWDVAPAAVDGPNGETSAQPGPYTVYGQWEDLEGNWSAVATDTIVLDTDRPVAAPTLDGGATVTADAEVLLDPGVTDDDGAGPSWVCSQGEGGDCRYVPGNSGPIPWMLGDPGGPAGPRTVCVYPYDVVARWRDTACATIEYLATAQPSTPPGHVGLAMAVGSRLAPTHWSSDESLTVTPVFGAGRSPAADAVCTWELRWGDHAALRDGEVNGTGGGVITSGTAAEGFCAGWTFGMPRTVSGMATISFTARSADGTLLAATPSDWAARPRFKVAQGNATPAITSSSLPIVTLAVEGSETPGETLVYSATPQGFTPSAATLTGRSPTGTVVTSPNGTSLAVTAPEEGRWSVRWTGLRGSANVAAYLDPSGSMLDVAAPRVVAPMARPLAGATLGTTAVPIRLSWAGTDDGSGVAGFEVAVSRDGGGWTPVALSAASGTSATISLARSGTTRYRVKAIDRAGNWSPWVEGPVLRPVFVDDRAATIRGSWTRRSSSAWLLGSTRTSFSRGASASYTFTGTAIAWMAAVGPTRGRATVSIDGRIIGTVDLRASTVQTRRQAFTWATRTPGPHTIRIVVSGTAGRPRVDVDGFLVIR